jgi:hypothetical protein
MTAAVTRARQPRHAPSIREGINWARVCLPPCPDRLIDNIEAVPVARLADLMHANLTYAYYAPRLVQPDPGHDDRERRIANRQVVVVSRTDGSIITTWCDRRDVHGTAWTDETTALTPVPPHGPRDYRDLMDLLCYEGAEVEEHRDGNHLSVRTPAGHRAFVPAHPDAGDHVETDAAVLRRLGCVLLRSMV